ncbi:Hpt domain-containing protein [Solirubrobacter soli]|uniref:Hpt domain-containing protein n=1 Tax=Solirubrobacter soli TaxID=363832 RepID=UPI000422F3C9|nr:Hpt domain-containing protein [Solirubrobacter soli]
MQDTLSSAIRELWAQWRPTELARVGVIERAAAKGPHVLERERREAQAEAHRLAGTLAVLGETAAADHARALERRFLSGELDAIEPLVRSLRAALEAPPLGSAP